jgi:hypothetical protein
MVAGFVKLIPAFTLLVRDPFDVLASRKKC